MAEKSGKSPWKWALGVVIVPLIPVVITVWDRVDPPEAPSLGMGPLYQQLDRFNANMERLIALYEGKALRPISIQKPDVVKNVPKQLYAQRFGNEISLQNSSRYLGRDYYVGRPGWEWTVYVTGSKGAMKQIRSVEYFLHPTFTPSSEEVTQPGDPNKAYPLVRRGWGTFAVRAEVTFRDGSKHELSHYLVFVRE